jgi:L-glutamine-phosphate cytidylyltransferase
MKAIVLSAGQGRRLLPLTVEEPKCLLSVDVDRSILELQLQALASCGIERVCIMVGFGAARVERFLAMHRIKPLEVRTRYNPFFATSNNLVTCWLAMAEMTEDFVLLNGDTLFEPKILRRLLASPPAPVTLTIDRKAEYDEDDMKVSLVGDRRLIAVGKTLPATETNGESVGLMLFRGTGVEAFRGTLEAAIRHPAALQQWYLSVINTMAGPLRVEAELIKGLWWAEIDTPEDLRRARTHFAHQQAKWGLAERAARLGEV